MDKLKQRYAIFYLHHENKTTEEIHQYLVEHYGESAYALSTVGKWIWKIKLGRTDLSNEKHSGRPIDESIREEIRQQIQNSPVFSDRSIARATEHSHTTVAKVLHDDLGFNYLHLQTVPHNLTDDKRTKRVEEAKKILAFLKCAKRSHNANIITGDESWFRYTNEPRARWVPAGEEVGTRIKESQYLKKKMVTIFIRKNGKFFVDLMPSDQTFNSDYFVNVIIPKINDLAFPNGYQKGDKKAYIHFDNAPSHKSSIVKETLKHYPFILIPHPAYSPDISPLDFGVFGTIKEKMPYEEFESDEELKDAITSILGELGPDYIKNLFKEWIRRAKLVISTNGKYI